MNRQEESSETILRGSLVTQIAEKNLSLKQMLEDMADSIHKDEPVANKDFSSEDLSLLYAIAHNLYQVGDFDQAKLLFTQLIVSKPFEGKHWQGLGATLQMLKEYHRALTAWSMAALIDDSDPVAHFHAAECLLSLDNGDEAMKALREAKARIRPGAEHEPIKVQIESIEERWIKSTEEA